jgi:hypothetical protein
MNKTGKGTFKPGVSGNPGGRPRATTSLAIKAREFTDEMLAVLVKNAKKGSTAAAIAVLDRGYGKPGQNIDMKLLLDKKLSDLTTEELAALHEQLAAMGLDEGGEE